MGDDGLLGVKRRYWETVDAHRRLGQGGAERLVAALHAPDGCWHGPHPINSLGAGELVERLWRPLLDAFPDLERRTDILVAGRFKDGDWVASTGHFVGRFMHDWLGIPATKRPTWLRYGWFDRIENARVVESYVILDIPGAMMQAGVWPLSPSLGAEIVAPAPAAQDGLSLAARDEAESDRSRALVEAMIGGLMQYDGKSLASMGMVRFWTPDFHWYGPSGIGTMRGHADYERGHQGPFLRAFPDRVGGNHKCRVGDGPYVASTGWPSIRATHLGGGWLGTAATGRPVTMRVMDFWRREGDLLSENWVFIDLIDLLLQMDVDVFARMQERLS
jgi:predicted ester cyclase